MSGGGPWAVSAALCGRLLAASCVFAWSTPLGLAAEGAGRPVPIWPQVGDCVQFREGGNGRLLKSPTYWVRGAVADLTHERRLAGVCPIRGKMPESYSRADWLAVASSMPCVVKPEDVREVGVVRVSVLVDAWETPWSNAHGSAGWLFRGLFLDQPLSRGGLIDMDLSWLERCDSGA